MFYIIRVIKLLTVFVIFCNLSSSSQLPNGSSRTDTSVVYARYYQVDGKVAGRYTINNEQGDFIYYLEPTGKLTKTKLDCKENCPDEVGSYSIEADGVIVFKQGSENVRYLLYRSADYYFLVEEGKKSLFEKETSDWNRKSINSMSGFQVFVASTLSKRYLSRKMP
jgi:hypothetical protein